MTTVTQADAYMHRLHANASPFRVLVSAHVNSGGDPSQGGPKRYYQITLAVLFEDELFPVKTLQAWADTRSQAVVKAKSEAIRRKLYFAPGLWSNWGNSDHHFYRLDKAD